MSHSARPFVFLVAGVAACAALTTTAAAQVVRPATPRDDYKAAVKADAKAPKYSAKAERAAMKQDAKATKWAMKTEKSAYLDRKADAKVEKARLKLERKAPPTG